MFEEKYFQFSVTFIEHYSDENDNKFESQGTADIAVSEYDEELIKDIIENDSSNLISDEDKYFLDYIEIVNIA